MTIAFGTEGWRAVIAEQFTADNVRIVTQAIAEHVLDGLHGSPSATMAVGYDTRFLSDYFAKAVCEVLAGNDIRCFLADQSIPTCAVSRYVVDKHLPAGIMVTASHNPGIYNGIKVKEAFGGSSSPETVASIEQRLGHAAVKRVPLEEAVEAGTVETVKMMPNFLRGIKSFVDIDVIRRSPFRVVVDSMHGTGGRIIEGLLKGGKCRVETIHAERDPLFGGHAPEPIPGNLKELMATVKTRRADLGIANDGDADRLGIIGPGGVWRNPGQVMCVLLMHLVKTRKLQGSVVKTVSNTMMINRVADALGLKLVEVPVGFKYVAKLMLQGQVLIGGEESGGIGIQGYLPERDGIVNGLMVLEAMAVRKQTFAVLMRDLERQFGRWYYGRRDLHLKMAQVDEAFKRLKEAPPSEIAGIPVVEVNAMDGVKLVGRDHSWLLFRRSGTEPIVRIYAETPQQTRLTRLLEFGIRLVDGQDGS